jgi:hypothetical protein
MPISEKAAGYPITGIALPTVKADQDSQPFVAPMKALNWVAPSAGSVISMNSA